MHAINDAHVRWNFNDAQRKCNRNEIICATKLYSFRNWRPECNPGSHCFHQILTKWGENCHTYSFRCQFKGREQRQVIGCQSVHNKNVKIIFIFTGFQHTGWQRTKITTRKVIHIRRARQESVEMFKWCSVLTSLSKRARIGKRNMVIKSVASNTGELFKVKWANSEGSTVIRRYYFSRFYFLSFSQFIFSQFSNGARTHGYFSTISIFERIIYPLSRDQILPLFLTLIHVNFAKLPFLLCAQCESLERINNFNEITFLFDFSFPFASHCDVHNIISCFQVWFVLFILFF